MVRGIALGAGKGVLQAIEKEATVGKSGQDIVEEIAFELQLGVFAVGDVAVDDYKFLDFAGVVSNGAGSGFEHAPAAVFVADAVFDFLADAGAAASRAASSTLKRSSG